MRRAIELRGVDVPREVRARVAWLPAEAVTVCTARVPHVQNSVLTSVPLSMEWDMARALCCVMLPGGVLKHCGGHLRRVKKGYRMQLPVRLLPSPCIEVTLTFSLHVRRRSLWWPSGR
jgi:hypothetical protein